MRTNKWIILMLCFLSGCSLPYKLHVSTIPKGDYDIYVNNKKYGNTGINGDTSIQTDKMSTLNTPLLEIKKNDTVYGYSQLKHIDSTYPQSTVKSSNLYSIKAQDYRKYDLTFLVNIDFVPQPLTENDIDPVFNKFDFKKREKAKIVYSIIGSDTNSYSYWGLKRHLDRYLGNNGYSWLRADSILFKTMSDTSLKNCNDSLSYEIYTECSKQGIKYLVLFFGFSINYSKGIAPADVGASLAITSLGLLSGNLMGLFFFAIPNGQSEISNPTICCAIYSVNPNRCVFKGKETMTNYNNDDNRQQANTIFGKLFSKIDFLINK